MTANSAPFLCIRYRSLSHKTFLTPVLKVNWATLEPSHTKGGEKEVLAAFERTFNIFEQRINKILALPLDKMNNNELENALDIID